MDRPPPTIPDYELSRRIGRGGYGEVWLARSITGLYRAVKIIYRAQFDDDRPYEREFTGIKRFEPISRAHDSQVDILHVGRNDGAGYFYYVMELADDANSDPFSAPFEAESYTPKTLKAVLSARNRLTVGEAVPIAVSLSDALAHLHENGLVHRDIKPSNIIFVDGRPKLADIGLIAKTDATRSFVGTEGYVPREGPGTLQADIFALGKVLYETCTGRGRLDFPSLPENLEALPDRVELREMNEVLLKACDPNPELRYASASDLKNDLELIRAQRSVRRLRKLERTVRRGRKLAVAATLMAAVIAFGWYQSHRFNRMAASQLARVYVKNGQERLDQNDWLGSLPWLAKALDLEHDLPDRAAAHRLRIANVLEWCPRLAALYTHSGPVRYAFFDADANRALLCDTGTTAQVWDSATDRPITPKLEHGGQPYMGVFSPDGTRVATLSRGDGAARLWDARTGTLIGHLIFHGAQVRAIAFSGDGRWLATAGEDGCARLCSAADGLDAGPVLHHGSSISVLAFSRNSHLLLTAGGTNGSAASVCVWDTATGRRLGAPAEESGPINVAQFNPDGDKIVIGAVSGEVSLWTIGAKPSGCWTQSMDRPILRAVFSPDGERLLTATEWSARLWDARTGQPIGSLIQSSGSLRSAEFNSDGSRFLLAGESRTALMYDARTGRPLPPLLKHAGEIYRAFFVSEGNGWITASADGTVRRWSLSKGDHDQGVFIHPNPVKHLLITPDSRWIVTVDGSGGLRRWPLAPHATEVKKTRMLTSEVSDATLSGDGMEILLGTRDDVLSVISVEDFETIATAPGPAGGISRIVPRPGQPQAVIAARDGSVWFWDWNRGTMESLSLSGIGVPTQIEFSVDGRTLAFASDRNVIPVRFSGSTRKVGKRIHHEDRIWHVGFSADSDRLLVSSEDRVMRWWNPATSQPLTAPMHGDGGINLAEFSADHQRVFTTSANYDAMIWSATTGQPMTPPFKPRPGLTAATFSPDGNWLAITSGDGSLQVWDTSAGEAMTAPLPTRGTVSRCVFSPDGRWLVTVEDARAVVCRPFVIEATSNNSSIHQATLLSGYRVDNHGFLAPISPVESARLAKTVSAEPRSQ